MVGAFGDVPSTGPREVHDGATGIARVRDLLLVVLRRHRHRGNAELERLQLHVPEHQRAAGHRLSDEIVSLRAFLADSRPRPHAPDRPRTAGELEPTIRPFTDQPASQAIAKLLHLGSPKRRSIVTRWPLPRCEGRPIILEGRERQFDGQVLLAHVRQAGRTPERCEFARPAQRHVPLVDRVGSRVQRDSFVCVTAGWPGWPVRCVSDNGFRHPGRRGRLGGMPTITR